ncbi:MAG: hypothetical protein ACKVP7_24920 [Hyphomicrobiaceae bacterium]
MPPELKDILLLAVMNPATLMAGYWLGRRADQVQKLVIAAFIAAIVGTIYVWLLMRFGFFKSQPRLVAGVFIASALLGGGWSWLGYWTRRHRKQD